MAMAYAPVRGNGREASAFVPFRCSGAARCSYFFLPVSEEDFATCAENVDTAAAGLSLDCFGFFFSRLLRC